MNLFTQIILWLLAWTLVVGFFEVVMARRGIDHLKNFHITSIYFLLSAVISFLIFKKSILLLVPRVSTAAIISLIIYYILTILVHYLVIKNLPKPQKFLDKNPKLYFAPLTWSHVVSNSFFILFQQILFVAIISILHQSGYSTAAIIGILMILSFVVHIALIHKIGRWWGWYFVIFSMVAAIVYPLLILFVKDGAIYAFITQSAFYTISAIGIWLLKPHSR